MASVTMTLVDPSADHGHHIPSNERSRQWQRPWQWSPGSQTERDYHHAAPVPLRRERIPDRRQAGAAARHSGSVHRHRTGPGKLRHHRAGAHRPDSEQQAAGPARNYRRSRRHRQIQNQEAAGRSETGRRQAESGARFRHSGRSRPAGEFAQAPGFQGAALRRAEGRDDQRNLRKSLTGRFRMLEREAAKTALDLNLANTEFQNLSSQVAEREKEHAALQETCYRNDAELTQARQQSGRPATRAGTDARQAGFPGQADRRRSKSGSRKANRKRRSWKNGRRSFSRSWKRTCSRSRSWNADRIGARAAGGQDRRARTAPDRLCRIARRTLETGRQNVLRLLGEASALKNQLVQISEYLSAIERDSARCQQRRANSGRGSRRG